MTYEQFLEAYPYLDLILELFKGIAPTLVALLAIFINNSTAKTRDKINKKKDIENKIKTEMLYKFIEIAQMYYESGALALDYLPLGGKERENKFSEYGGSLYKFLYKANEINDYYQTMFKSFDININCECIVETSKKYSNRLNDIVENYNNVHSSSVSALKKEKLYDKAAREISEATAEARAWLNITMVQISDSMQEGLNK